MIFWITGLSGAGKTTVGRYLHAALRKITANVVLIDGDEVRDWLNLNALGDAFSEESRRRIGEQYFQMCRWLDRQEIHVVCCTICNFPYIRDLNRRTFAEYFEVFVSVPLEILTERDTKGLYRRALNGETGNVVGVDIPFIPPASPNLIIDNTTFTRDPIEWAQLIVSQSGFVKQPSPEMALNLTT